eukprot:8906847-Alexandrium_andersonii.AAC.1
MFRSAHVTGPPRTAMSARFARPRRPANTGSVSPQRLPCGELGRKVPTQRIAILSEAIFRREGAWCTHILCSPHAV